MGGHNTRPSDKYRRLLPLPMEEVRRRWSVFAMNDAMCCNIDDACDAVDMSRDEIALYLITSGSRCRLVGNKIVGMYLINGTVPRFLREYQKNVAATGKLSKSGNIVPLDVLYLQYMKFCKSEATATGNIWYYVESFDVFCAHCYLTFVGERSFVIFSTTSGDVNPIMCQK